MILPYCSLIKAVVQRAVLDARKMNMGSMRPGHREVVAADAREFLMEWGLPSSFLEPSKSSFNKIQ